MEGPLEGVPVVIVQEPTDMAGWAGLVGGPCIVSSFDAQGPAAVGVKFGQFGLDVHSDDAEEVDVLAVGWGDVSQDLVGDVAALGA